MHLLTQSPLLKALGWALFDSLWQMALLWLLYSMLTFVFSQITAGIRHGLALMFISLGAFWSGATFIAAYCWPHRDHWITGSWLNLLPAAQYGRLWQLSRFFTDVILVDGSSIYLLILGGLLIRYLYHYRQSRQLTRHGLSKLPSELRVFVSATSNRMDIRPTVSAWLSSKVDVPLTLGHLKPVILLPVAMVNHLSPQQVEAILVHELAHIRRHDYLLHLAVTTLEGFFFFNPFARLLIRQIKNERENCCDDLVLQFRYDRHSYVSALLSLATRSQKIQRAIAATSGGDRLLLQRAKRILQQKQSHDRPGVRPLVLLLFTGLITLITVYGPVRPMARQQALQTALTVTTHPVKASVPTGLPALTAPIDVRPALRITLSVRTIATAMTSPQAKTLTKHLHQQQTTIDDNDAGPDAVDAGDGQPEDNNNIAFINTADDQAAPDDSVISDYSIRLTRPGATPGKIIQLHGTPFVPNTSFSYQLTVADSTHPAEQLIYLQESTRRDILTALNNLHRQFEQQMKALAVQQVKATESLQLRRQVQSQELQLQQLYLKKIAEFEKRLEKTSHLRMIVDI